MRVIAQLLQSLLPLKPGLEICIPNPPWQDLLIREVDQRGPHGSRVISVAHQYEYQGRNVRVPEMLFEVDLPRKDVILTPYCLRDEVTGSDEHSVYRKEGRIVVNYRLQAEHMKFARSWDKCLGEQGLLPAFQRSYFIQELRLRFAAEISAGTIGDPEQLKQLLDRVLSATQVKRNGAANN